MAIFRELGPYQIARRIGKGGMGDVFLAHDTRKAADDPTRTVALKVMWKDIEKDCPGVLEAERQGATLQSRLYAIDNRVARVNGFGELDDCFYIDMEYIEGRDLTELIQQGPIKPLEATRIAIEVCDILLRVHTMRFEHQSHDSRGVVHGDIKPRNIRLEPSGRVRLLDFGIAKALSMTRKLTRNEFGSVGYSSPERLDTGEVNEHSDLWATAVVLYEMLMGTAPFAAENTRKIEQLILARTIPRPVGPQVPPPLKEVLAKALAPRIEDRYLSAVHFKKALQGAQSSMQFSEHSGRLNVAGAAQESPDATRRTVRPADMSLEPDGTRRTFGEPLESDGTRRTLTEVPPAGPVPLGAPSAWPLEPATVNPPPVVAAPSALAHPPAEGLPAQASSPGSNLLQRRLGLFVGLGVLILAAVVGVREVQIQRAIPSFVQELNGRSLSCANAWDRYQQLSRGSLFGSGLSQVRDPLVRMCRDEAEQVLKRYRTDDPRVFESDWKRANEAASHILALQPGDQMRAWYNYTLGHIRRINKDYDAAKARYDTAAELDPTFCDPYLGMIFMYTYNVPDYASLQDSYQKLLNRGCQPGRRQEVQMADARLKEASRLLKEDNANQDRDERRQNLNQTRDLLEQAQATYKQYPRFGDASKHSRTIDKLLKDVDGRLEQVTEPEPAAAPLWPWSN